MTVPPLTVHDVSGMTCVGVEGRPRKVSFAFVGRTGGVSVGAFSTLNVGDLVGDDAAAVDENRRRALAAIGVSGKAALSRVVVPRQVHGTDVVCVNASDADTVAAARRSAAEGADAVVVSAPGVSTLMSFADCVPVVLVAQGAYAVVHSGWRGTLGRVVASAASALARASGCAVGDLWAYLGPHIGAASYEVSEDLARSFASEFDDGVIAGARHVDLAQAIATALIASGVKRDAVVDCGVDTATSTQGWFSHRASGGHTGRHAAVATVFG